MATSIVPRAVPQGKSIYRFKVSLDYVQPAIWRRLEVPGNFTFAQLGKVIIAGMGWEGYHLYTFMGTEFEIAGPGAERDEEFWASYVSSSGFTPPWRTQLEARRVKISDIFSMDMKTLEFEYDLGDCWDHSVLLESISPPVEGYLYPACIAGENACPPEDFGGPYFYQNLLEIIRNRGHRENNPMTERWKDFDPTRFDPSEVTFG
jgi:serine/threonine protein kinase